MDYLTAFNVGFEEGKRLPLKLINDHCGTEFETLTDVINYIREVEFNSRLEQTDV